MHTLIVTMTTDPNRSDEVARHLQNEVAPWAKQQPGFIHGDWLQSQQRDRGLGIVVFDSGEAADHAARGPRNFPHDADRAWNITTVTIYESVATA